MSECISNPGYDELWLYFGLSYASWLTLPRAFMHEMPDEWQGKMAALLREFDETFDPWQEIESCTVSGLKDGKFVPLPEWSSRAFYRHPRQDVIDAHRKKHS